MWNYRVLKEEVEVNENKIESYRVIEVYYDDDNSIEGWADCTHDILQCNKLMRMNQAYEDLKGSAEHVLDAFKLPVLTKDENDKLSEVGRKKICCH